MEVPSAGHQAVTTREQIVRAAADSLLAEGYAATSMRAIAARAGMAVGNVQYHFPAKSDLLVEAWRDLTDRSVEELREALAQIGDPADLFQVGPDAIWAALRQLADIQLAAFDLLVQAPRRERLKAYLPELFDRYRLVVEEQLDRFEKSGRLRLTVEREVLVPLVLNTVLGFGLYYVVTGDDESCLRALGAFQQLAPALVERGGEDSAPGR